MNPDGVPIAAWNVFLGGVLIGGSSAALSDGASLWYVIPWTIGTVVAGIGMFAPGGIFHRRAR